MLISSPGSDTEQNLTALDWAAILPDSLSGWQKAEDQLFNRENLYNHIDGGAELYLSYGFRSLFSRTYNRTGQPDLVVEIFDMTTSANAFGVFAHTRETIDSTFGQGSQYIEGLLLFWKDRYLVSLSGSPETEVSRQVVFDLAGQIDRAIGQKGSLPAMLTLLPAQGLIQPSIRYFHHHIWLNTYYYIADRNILHIDQNCEAVLARYQQNDTSPLLLLIIKYPDSVRAQQAEQDFIRSFLPEAAERMPVQIEDKHWTGYRLHQTILMIIFNGSRPDSVELLFRQLESKLNSSTELK
jgi:hypothetical protein